MNTMELKDGRIIAPMTDYDILEEVYNYMGQDVHDYLANAILDINVQENIAQQKFNSDYRAMEFECENWHDFVDEVSNQIESLMEEVADGKITKARIYQKLSAIHREMRGEL